MPEDQSRLVTEEMLGAQPTPQVMPDADTTKDWEILLKAMKDYDKTLIEGWVSSMNNLLIFAGLFSAVVTAFIIESYSWLQPDSTDASNVYLAQISLQLASFSVNSAFINSTASSGPAAPAPFEASALNVHINVLWFLSLAISLIASLFAILVQQWLSEYPVRRSASVRQGVRLRQFRYDNLYAWGVADIINLLPVLLQIALILFLVGLLLLLWSLNTLVARVVTGFLSLPLAFFLSTAFLPLLSPACPYKSTLTTILLTWMLSLRALVVGVGGACVYQCLRPRLYTPRGRGFRWDGRGHKPSLKRRTWTASALAFSRMATRADWINHDFIQIQYRETHLDRAAVLWSPRALSDDDLKLCLLNLSRTNQAVCALEWASVAFNVRVRLASKWISPIDLEADLRAQYDTIQLDYQVVEQLRNLLLDSLLPWEDDRENRTIRTLVMSFLRHLIKLDPLPDEPYLVRYRSLLLSAHSTSVPGEKSTEFLPFENDSQVRVITRSLLDCLVGELIPADCIDLAEHDRRVLAFLDTCSRDEHQTYYLEKDDCAAIMLATAFFLHQHNTLSTSESLLPLITALERFVRNRRRTITTCATRYLDAQRHQTNARFVPAWAAMVLSLHALALRSSSNSGWADALLPIINDLIDIFKPESGLYFKNVLNKLQDLRAYLSGNAPEHTTKRDRLECVMRWAALAFNMTKDPNSGWLQVHELEGLLRKQGVTQPDRDIVDRLRRSLLDSLLGSTGGRSLWELEFRALGHASIFLQHLVKLDPPLDKDFIKRYRNAVISTRANLTGPNMTGIPSPGPIEHAHAVLRSYFDLCVSGLYLPGDQEVAEHDRRALATLGACRDSCDIDTILDCSATTLATVFFLHQRDPWSTINDAMQPFVAELERIVQAHGPAITKCARKYLDAEQTTGYIPVWLTLVQSLHALAKRSPPDRVAGDVLLRVVKALIEVFRPESHDAYFQDALKTLRDLRRFLTRSNPIA